MFCLLLPYIRLLSFIFPAQFVLVKCLSRTPVDVSQENIKTKTFTDNHLENNNPQKNQIMQKKRNFSPLLLNVPNCQFGTSTSSPRTI